MGSAIYPVSNNAEVVTTIRPVATDYSDSATDAPVVSISGFSVVRAAVNARLRIDVPVGCYSVKFRVIGNSPDTALPIGVYVDGVWNQALFVPVGETTLRELGVAFNGQHHTMELWLPYQTYKTLGAFIYDVRGVGIRLLAPVQVARRIICYGDSILSGAFASPNTQLGWIPLIRQQTTASWTLESWAGRRLFDDSGVGGGQLGYANHTLLADRFGTLAQGATIADVYIQIGVNDISGYTPAQLQTEYSDLLDKTHARLPSAIIYCQTMTITTTLEASAPACRTAIANSASGRGYCVVIDGPSLCDVGNLQDGLHPNNTGHAQIATRVRPLVGL